ncbi:hypothetical protein [Roseimaritima sediminicola]|uniref:hypothetical protein n=1 Tax=Roseimaritima sediminicola TaxID=2662066 RepID=UPI0012982EA5|nr:hypothetical protein [Roseimaritima sediminicola]
MTKKSGTPDWFTEEAARAKQQASLGTAVNDTATGGPKAVIKRINKAFQVEEGRAAKWHLLVAKQKAAGRGHKSGPELIDEALDMLFEKHGV